MSQEDKAQTVVHGHDVLSLVAERGGRCTVFELRAAAAHAFGPKAVFGNCHGHLFDFDGLVEFLEGKGKLARAGEMLSLGPVPPCSGH
jgi:probable metal-binding protein